MGSLTAYRLPTGELVFSPPAASSGGLARLPWQLLNSEFFGFLTAFVVSLTALALAGS
jgi:hypothetical protein